MDELTADEAKEEDDGSSPVGRGGAGTYIEGELGAFYLLQMLAGSEARGLPNTRIERIQFQGVDEGYALDDLIVHGLSDRGSSLLEIQSKRTITFAPKDSIFQSVCEQIVRSAPTNKPTDRHVFAVATQRTSFAISGPYQDVLEWARVAKTGAQLFERLALKGVASDAMRSFARTFRANLVAKGVTDDDEAIWNIIRHFLILEFDFESGAPQARAHALTIATQVLAPEDVPRAEALWSSLIELVIKTGKSGGAISRDELPGILADRGFQLTGTRDYTLARARLAEMSRFALRDIGSTVGGVNLPRLGALASLEKARDRHRFIEIIGKPGVGKSYVLRHLAERVGSEANAIVLDPIGTPGGGWAALAQRLDIPGTARDFLADLAASGGGVLFIDGLEMFASPERRRTINDLLREVAAIDGFAVVVSNRPDFDVDGRNWLAEDALAVLGPPCRVLVGELDDEEVAALSELAPELRALLAPGHPAASISRNLYRLTQLLKVPSTVEIRTEAALADRWWQTADGAQNSDIRAAQRILADLAKAALSGRDTIEAAADSPARDHMLNSLTLSEPQRDRLGFYHDVLRDWAIGAILHEDTALIEGIDLTVAPSPRLTRGVEFAGRFALEKGQDGSAWKALLAALSRAGAHDAWRRQALMAIVRSELSPQLLNRCRAALLAQGGALLSELCTAITAVETAPVAELFAQAGADGEILEAPRSVRAATTPSAPTVVLWCASNVADIPIQAIPAIVKLVEIQFFLALGVSQYGQKTCRMLFKWLMQLDIPDAKIDIPSPPDAPKIQGQARQQLISDLRSMTLLLAGNAPEETKTYLTAVEAENNSYKFKAIRPFGRALAKPAPRELAALVERSLIETPHHDEASRSWTDRALSFADTDYLPASPAQPPFLDLLEAAPDTGLALIRKLVETSVTFHARGKITTNNGYTLVFDGKPRFFPWIQTYFWARGQAQEYSAASGLMALEAWSQERLDKGDDVQAVLGDILGPEGSCAAYLLTAIDVLLSHWPTTRDALAPFLANPELLSNDRTRVAREALAGMRVGKEPSGRIKLADLAKRPSRQIMLESLLPAYLDDDEAGRSLRTVLRSAVGKLEPFSAHSSFADPALMGAYALNRLDRANWVEADGLLSYRSPPAEAKHLAKLEEGRRNLVNSSEIEAKIQLAVNDPARGSAESAREAVDYAAGGIPDGSDTDSLKSRSTRLIATAMLVARDGDDNLLDEHEAWVRQVIAKALEEEGDRYSSGDILEYNRPAMGICALVHLWHRRELDADRNLLVEAAARKDVAAVLAFKSALSALNETDPRLLKSAVRVAFACRRWVWHPYDEDPANQAAYEAGKERLDAGAVGSEITWLDGGTEPIWPILPEEAPSLRDAQSAWRSKARTGSHADGDDGSVTTRSKKASVHVDTQAVAKFLGLLSTEAKATPEWYGELVDAYALWSARLNGHGHPPESDLDRTPDDWNHEFYILVAAALMGATEERMELLLKPILELPDQSFCDVAASVIHAADVLYFNGRRQPASHAIKLRERLVTRTMALARWSWHQRGGNLSIDYVTGPPIAKLLMNFYNPFGGTESYLVPAVFDSVDPLLETLRPLLPGGPTAFVALCTMNTLLVAPTARHLDFLLFAVEVWLEATRNDPSMWHSLGIGRKIAQWFEKAAIEDLSLLRRGHFERARIDATLGRLVSLGVSQAHDIEIRIQAEGGASR
ncbi:hypothetical protein [Rhizobium leguminosarum]|uniref:hypothetical protein n=1 Tax=Rhizobium leguminosarum TaxID=384 RepID=UPI003F99EDF0